MTYEEILDALSNYNPDALLLEPRSVYDPCIVGMTDTPNDHWPREPGFVVAVYDAEMCVEAIMADGECSYSDAVEWFSFNTSGAWMGQNTPTFRYIGWEE